MVQFSNSWDTILKDEFSQEYYLSLRKKLIQEYKTQKVHPPMADIFNAQKLCDYKAVKVVILGQDPYHGENQAHGLAFSVQPGVTSPPSLQNIFKELTTDISAKIPNNGCLTPWAKQGVLLLNTTLTVREGLANSHKDLGWQTYTDHVISALNKRSDPMVFLLWGGHAKSKASLITNPNHTILTAPHPSPLSVYRGFYGCKHFSKTNEILISHKKSPINWQINDI